MSRRRTRVTSTRRRFEILLLLAGLACISIWLGSMARTSISQDWANWSFDRKLHGQPVTVSEYLKDRLGPRTGTKPPVAEEQPPATAEKAPAAKPPAAKPPALKTGDMIGRLSVPRLKVEAVVREGSNASTLDLALGHIPGTAVPGQAGNVGVAGHRDTLFRGLRNIRKNDRIEFETLNGTYAYEVESTRIVKPKNVSVLEPGKSPELTLVTCYPFYYVGSAPDRFIVKARLVEENAAAEKPAKQDAPKTAQNTPQITQAALTTEPVKPSHVVKEAPKLVKPARITERSRPPRSGRRVFFHITDGHSQSLAPGISLGLDWSDASSKRLHGWMWVMPDRRTIWLTGENAREPVVFYGHDDGKRREIVITGFGRNSVSGYLQLPPG